MSKWTGNTVDDITLFIKDGTHGTHKDFPNGIPLLSAKDIEGGKLMVPDDCRTISESDYKQIHANYEILDDDILLTLVGTIGRVAIVKDLKRKITFQRSVGILRIDKNKVFPAYSYYFFQSNEFQRQLERSKNASAQGGVYLGELAKAKVLHPESLLEQSQIAKILSTADTVIEKTQAAIAKYKAIKQGLLHDLFTRGIDINTGKLRHKYEDAPELYKESKLGWVPKAWDVEIFSETSEIINGGTPSTQNKEYWNGNIPWLSVEDFNKERRFVCDAIKKISDLGLKNSATNLLKKGMIIISARGTVGVIAQVGRDMAFNQSCYGINSQKQNLINDFIYYFLLHYKTKFGFSSFGSVFSTITRDYFDSMEIAFPQNECEMHEIVNKLSQVDNKLLSEQAYLTKLQAIKQGLMSDLLTGRKRV
ncbi:restriction endonuclease subunit S [Draconibacterium orientale]|uniref:restriction endonuclease subunit S n=1 Tax=Draconibacterium orientale TaxID=1168034 RepID=UPI002A0A1963|nr:restriction endonuclease subunit S [Draconibacterium orientale]